MDDLQEELRIKMLLNSYGLKYLLEVSDLTDEVVIALLVSEGLLDLEDYFYE